jgi:hypothetical protein
LLSGVRQAGYSADGFQVFDRLLTEATLEGAQNLVDRALQHIDVATRSRGILRVPIISSLARLPEVRSIASSVLGGEAYCVEAELIDASAKGARDMPWRQEFTLPFRAQVSSPEFGPWTQIDGVWIARAPRWLLASTTKIVLSLDERWDEDAPDHLIPGSHVEQFPDESSKLTRVRRGPVASPQPPRGGALAMSPLILHARRAQIGAWPMRQVVLRFATGALPGGLQWSEKV